MTTLRVSETTFARHVLRARLPVLVCFGTGGCPAYRAMQAPLSKLAAEYAGSMLVATTRFRNDGIFATQYGIEHSPTLTLFHAGDIQGCVRGFMPEGMLRLFADDAIRGAIADYRVWIPVEKHFEDVVLAPLLDGWNLPYRRQVACKHGVGKRNARGVIDFLIYDQSERQPLALIESKRHIKDSYELRQAAHQASVYASSLDVAAFAVAAPSGMWIYAADTPDSCVRAVTSLEIHEQPELPRRILLELVTRAGFLPGFGSLHMAPAVDTERLAGNPPGQIRHKEQDTGSNIVG